MIFSVVKDNLCLVLPWVQNNLEPSKLFCRVPTVLDGPNLFWSDSNYRNIGPEKSHLNLTKIVLDLYKYKALVKFLFRWKLLAYRSLFFFVLQISKSQYFHPIWIIVLLFFLDLQEQVKKVFCYQKLFWLFTVWMNCSSYLKNFAKFFSITRTIFVHSRSEQFW